MSKKWPPCDTGTGQIFALYNAAASQNLLPYCSAGREKGRDRRERHSKRDKGKIEECDTQAGDDTEEKAEGQTQKGKETEGGRQRGETERMRWEETGGDSWRETRGRVTVV